MAASGRLDERLGDLYALRFNEQERAAKSKVWRVLVDHFFARYIPANATVVDLGAGYCDFINHVHAARRVAVDLNPETKRCAAPGVEVHQSRGDELDSLLEPESVDAVFASNVFEHLRSPEALLDTLRAVRAVLRPGGKLLILQPNIRCVGGAFWDFFDHTLPLTEKGMIEALGVANFEIARVIPRFLPYTTKSRWPQAPWMVRAYLSVPIAWRILGKQMFVVARRPD